MTSTDKRLTDSWIICETSGRWAAALRADIARQATSRTRAQVPSRIREVRYFDQFQAAIGEGRYALGLLEVRRDNLAATLAFLSSPGRSPVPVAALLHETVQDDSNAQGRSPAAFQFSADALREAGALAAIDSPRRISELLRLTGRLAAVSSRSSAIVGGQPSFAEWAWAALPWQDE